MLRVAAPMTVTLAALSRAVPNFPTRFAAVQLDLNLDKRRVDLIGEG